MTNFLKISEASSLAIHAMYFITISEKKQMSVKELASRMGASSNHLSKVLQQLAKNGLIKSMRGPTGGYFLAKAPDEISISDIYEVIEGKFSCTECLFPQPICGRSKCILGDMIPSINNKVIETMTNTKLSHLIEVEAKNA